MSNEQILTVALSTVLTMIVVLIGILLNTARLNDMKQVFDARLNDLKELLRAEIKVVDATIKVVEANIEKNHSEMLRRFGDLGTRLTRIENSLAMNRG